MVGRPRSITNETILDAVGATISSVGPERFTVADVGERVGFTAPGITNRFGPKRDLIIAYAKHRAASRARRFPGPSAANQPALDELVEGLAAFPTRPVNQESVVHHLAQVHLDLCDPDRACHVAEQSRTLQESIETLLAAAVEQGRLERSTDLPDLTASIYATYVGALVTWAIDGTGTLSDWIIDRVTRTIEPHTTA